MNKFSKVLHICIYIIQTVTGISKQKEPFSGVLSIVEHRECEVPNLIVRILFIWLCCCFHAYSHVCVRQVLMKNKESIFTQLGGCAPLKPQQCYCCVLGRNVDEMPRLKSYFLISSGSKLSPNCLSLAA